MSALPSPAQPVDTTQAFVLVRPALPRALRIANIDVDFGRQRKAAMIRKFLARSQVRDLYSSFGSFFASLMIAVTTVRVSCRPPWPTSRNTYERSSALYYADRLTFEQILSEIKRRIEKL
jgi:hypothetical protein